MSNVQIPNLGAAISLNGTEQLECVQSGTSVRVTTGQIASYTSNIFPVQNPLPANKGGTGFSSYTVGDMLYADTTVTLAKISDVAVGNALLSGGVNAAPVWGQVDLTTTVTGALPIANGGTGQITKAPAFNALSPITSTGDLIIGGGANLSTRLPLGGAGTVLSSDGSIPSWTLLSSLGVTSLSFGTTGLTPSSATTGAITVAGKLVIANGGTNATSVSGFWTNFGQSATTVNISPTGAGTVTIAPATAGTMNNVAVGGVTPLSGSFTSLAATGTLTATGAVTIVPPNLDVNIAPSGTGTVNITPTGTGSIVNMVIGASFPKAVTTTNLTLSGTTSTLTLNASVGTAGNILTSAGAGATPTWTSTLGPASGGTGLATYAVGDIIYASAATTLSRLADVATGNALISGGVTTAPSWGKIGLTTHVTGTLPVANGGTGAGTLTGVLKGTGTTAFVAATAGTDFVAPGTATTFTAKQTFTGSTSILSSVFTNMVETITVSATAATGTINYDVTTQSVLYYTTNASANWTVNFRASSGTSLDTAMSTGQSITVAFLVTQGGTAFFNNVVTVDGGANTPKWQGGTAPAAGDINSVDAYVYTIVKTGAATFTVFASQTQFK